MLTFRGLIQCQSNVLFSKTNEVCVCKSTNTVYFVNKTKYLQLVICCLNRITIFPFLLQTIIIIVCSLLVERKKKGNIFYEYFFLSIQASCSIGFFSAAAILLRFIMYYCFHSRTQPCFLTHNVTPTTPFCGQICKKQTD